MPNRVHSAYVITHYPMKMHKINKWNKSNQHTDIQRWNKRVKNVIGRFAINGHSAHCRQTISINIVNCVRTNAFISTLLSQI